MTLTTLTETKKPTKAKKKPRPKSAKPAKAYKYGCLPPTTGLEAIHDQIWLAHKYRNKLCEIERIRRERTESVLATHSTELVELDKRIAALDDEISKLVTAVKAARVTKRSKSAAPKEEREAIANLKAGRKQLYAERRALRKTLFASTRLKSDLNDINKQANAAIREARSECGLYWGTYLIVEDACKSMRQGAPPDFQRWEPGGTVAVQIQGGMTIEEAFAGKDSRFRLDPIPVDAWTHPRRGYRRKSCQTKAWLRVGSDEKKKPIWAVIPVVVHRGFPTDGRIKWVRLKETCDGPLVKWELILSVEFEKEPLPLDLAQHGRVGIDVGWRQQSDGSLRVACWDGDDGNHGELILDAKLIRRFDKVRDLRSIRDKNRDQLIDTLVLWFKSHEVPQAAEEEFSHLHLWKSPKRFHRALKWCRENPFDGAGALVEILEAWAKQERHLYYWEAHQRQRAQGHRREIYRLFAVEMRRKYATVCLENLFIPDFAELPAAEDGDTTSQTSRGNRTYVAPGQLLMTLKQSGARIEKVNPAYTSKTCSACGHVNHDLGSESEWICPACLVVHDRDLNAAKNIRRASGEVISKKRPPLADEAA